MTTKTIVILAAVAVAAWLFMTRKPAQRQNLNGAGSNTALIGTGVNAAGKILGAIFSTGGGSGGSRVGGSGQPTYTTIYDDLGASKTIGNGMVVNLEDA
jgi:hypothetical protein